MKTSRLFAGMAMISSFVYLLTATPVAFAAKETKEASKKEIKKEVEEVAFVGSAHGHTYHEPSSFMARKIKPENLVKFRNRAEAEKAGYSPLKAGLKG